MAQVKGIKIQTAGAWLSLVCGALSLVTGIYYAVAAGATNNFTATVLVCFLLGAVCALTYSLVPSDWGDILNLVAVVFLAVAILEFIVSSIATLADVLSGITMVFVPSVSTFAISKMLGGGTEMLLGDLIEQQYMGGAYNPYLGAAISLVMMVIVVICMVVMNRFGEGEEQAVMM